jgi:ATP-dependent RNA helicase DDX31/DBP7
LRRGITILIATPGRLLDHLTKTESLLLSLRRNRGLEWLVLDEADRLLDGGGLGGQVEQIVQRLRGCCGGSTRTNGSTANAWRSVLVSATITTELEGMARRVLGRGGDDGGWMWARGHNDDAIGKGNRGGEATMTGELGESLYGHDSTDDQVHSTSGQRANDVAGNDKDNSHELDNAAPRQLAQLYMIVSAKLRLSSLIAFLAARAAGGERTVVFFSTCDSVDYHHALFASMGSVLGGEDEENDRDEYADGDGESEKSTIGIFGRACSIYKLHGDVPHHKRVSTLRAFSDNGRQSSAILLATDVAARGLNFPSLDWIVQYDPPCETKDYVHRAGRSARAGQAGHALLFLLPSERQYIEVLGLRGLRDISPLSLSSTLSAAAALCKGVTREGKSRASMGSNGFSDGGAEAFTYAIQSRLEECVVLDDESYRTSIEKKFKGDPKQRRRKRKDSVAGPLLEGARKAFSAFVRAYPAKEKAVRHIFNARALHLGHIARSLALKETPKMVSKGNISNSGNSAVDCGEGVTRTSQDKTQSGFGKGEKRNSRLAFGNVEAPDENVGINDFEQERYLSLLDDAISGSARQSFGKSRSPSNKKIKLGGRSGKDNPKRMMEAAMLIQSQEYM